MRKELINLKFIETDNEIELVLSTSDPNNTPDKLVERAEHGDTTAVFILGVLTAIESAIELIEDLQQQSNNIDNNVTVQ